MKERRRSENTNQHTADRIAGLLSGEWEGEVRRGRCETERGLLGMKEWIEQNGAGRCCCLIRRMYCNWSGLFVLDCLVYNSCRCIEIAEGREERERERETKEKGRRRRSRSRSRRRNKNKNGNQEVCKTKKSRAG